MPREHSAGAVIFRKENNTIYYLLLHYQASHWDFPKGHLEPGETPAEAAKREIFEETGIKNIKFIPGFKTAIKYFLKARPQKIQLGSKRKTILKTVIFFLAGTSEKEVKISWEHKGFKWLRLEDALRQLTFYNAKNILKKADLFLHRLHRQK